MGYDLYRETEEHNDYFRWNIWGFPPVRFLGELYGWIPMGTIIPAWIEEDGNGHSQEEAGYDTNDGQIVCEEDANNWAEALAEALVDLRKIGHTKESKESQVIDDEYMAERERIWDKDADAIRQYFRTKADHDYLEDYITFLKKGEFRIY